MPNFPSSIHAIAQTRVCIAGLRALARDNNAHIAQSRAAIRDSLVVLSRHSASDPSSSAFVQEPPGV